MSGVNDRAIPRLALSIEEASHSLGCGRSFFYESVLPHLRVVRVGRRRFIPVKELERWLTENASTPLAEELDAVRKAS
jgi:excisionase family DNA binding protein